MQRYDARTALIVVDVQNDFADPSGGLAVRGGDAIIVAVNREVQAAAAAGAFIVYTQDWHPESTPHFVTDGGIWPVHCVAGTWGAEFHPALQVVGPSIHKGANGEDGYSGFTMRDPLLDEMIPTLLEPLLVESGAVRVVICGLATDYCVRETTLDAIRLGFDASVVTDAVAAVDRSPGDGERALREVAVAGAHLVGAADPAAPGPEAPV